MRMLGIHLFTQICVLNLCPLPGLVIGKTDLGLHSPCHRPGGSWMQKSLQRAVHQAPGLCYKSGREGGEELNGVSGCVHSPINGGGAERGHIPLSPGSLGRGQHRITRLYPGVGCRPCRYNAVTGEWLQDEVFIKMACQVSRALGLRGLWR